MFVRRMLAVALLTVFYTLVINSSAARAGLVTWSFYETDITSCFALHCALPSPPQNLPITFTLSSTTETGSAVLTGWPNSAAVTDPNFSLSMPGQLDAITPPLWLGNSSPNCLSCAYDITWNEIEGQLVSLSINIHGESTSVEAFGLTGGTISSDGNFGGCVQGRCQLTGYWVGPSISEPGSGLLVLSALIGLGIALHRRRRWPIRAGRRRALRT